MVELETDPVTLSGTFLNDAIFSLFNAIVSVSLIDWIYAWAPTPDDCVLGATEIGVLAK